jgi:Asp-tRNA(Asn)/Glu-tRNA(Gln) amidotransferase A subunit family amidase
MLAAYLETLDRLKLDGYVYPAIQMPPPDETMPQDGRVSEGPHSATSWINMIGVPRWSSRQVLRQRPAVRPGVFGRPWRDGDLLAIAYAWEQATHLRKPPALVEKGLLGVTPGVKRERGDERVRGL